MLNVLDYIATMTEAIMLYILLRPKTDSSKKIFLSSIGIFFICTRALTVFDFTQSMKLILLIGLDTFLSYFLFRNRIGKSVITGFLHLICIYMGEIIVQALFLIFYKPGLTTLTDHLPIYILAVASSKFLSLVCCMVIKNKFGSLTYPYPFRLALCLIFPMATILAFMAKLQEYIFGADTSAITRQEILFAFALLLSAICLLYIYQSYFRFKELQMEKELSEAQMFATFSFYQEHIQHDRNNRKIYHDIQAHINTLKELPDSEKKEEYRKELLETLESMIFFHDTGNETVDVVLNQKQPAFDSLGIKIVCIGDFKILNHLKPMDLVTIFHNALENALEEYRYHEHPVKVIEIHTWTFHRFINLRFTNYCSDNDQNLTKDNPDLHGYGLKNMEYALTHYDGEVIPEMEDGKFILRIVIPVYEEIPAEQQLLHQK